MFTFAELCLVSQEQEERDYFPETPQVLDLHETRAFGYQYPEREYLLSNYDVWVKNPHYQGEPGPHPEDDYYDTSPEGDDPQEVVDFEPHQDEGWDDVPF